MSPKRPWQASVVPSSSWWWWWAAWGSLAGAFLPLLIGMVQTFAVALDYSLIHVFKMMGGVTSRPLATLAQAHRLAGGAHPAVSVPGSDPDLPPQGSAGHLGGLRP